MSFRVIFLGLLAAGFFIPSTEVAAAPPIQFEEVPAEESAAINRVRELAVGMIKREHEKAPSVVVTRDAHAKAHGCVDAAVFVNPSDTLPSDLRFGMFANPGVNFKGVVRLSNGSGRAQSDHIPDGRGLALKVLNVPGKKILAGQENATTQDFLMINYPQFFVKDAADYVQFQENLNKDGSPLKFLAGHPKEAWIASQIAFNSITNPLTSQYFSMTPYNLGATNAVKYSAKPCKTQWFGWFVNPLNPNFLYSALKSGLEKEGACFDLMIQKAPTQAKLMSDGIKTTTRSDFPIEDPRVEWDSSQAPFVPVAKIFIAAKQDFDTPENWWTCENLSFTPWHSLPEHKPLGGINRTRKAVYEAISDYRHKANGQVRVEP